MDESSANGFLQIANNMTYSSPQREVSGETSYVSFRPVGSQFGPGQSVEIKLSSTNQYLSIDKSYLKFTFKEIGTVFTGSIALLNTIGATAFISSVSDTVSGLQLPPINRYNVMKALKLNTDTAERKAINQRLSLYGSSTIVQPTNAAGVGRTVCIPMPTCLSSSEKLLPLCHLQGGHTVSYQLETYARVFQNTLGTSSTYIIEDIQLVACLVKPSDAYLMEVNRALANGATLQIPLQIPRNISNQLAASTSQTIRLQTGFLGSLNSLSFVYRPTANFNKVATDNVNGFLTTTANIREYFINLNGQRYPRNKSIGVFNTVADPENLIQLLAAFSTETSFLNPPVETTEGFCHYSFKSNGTFSSGVPISDGVLSIELTTVIAPNPNDVLDVFFEYDSVLSIGANSVQLTTDV